MKYKLKSILEYSAKELVDLAKSDTPKRYRRRQSLGIPKVKDAYINYNNGSAVIVLDTHDHVQKIILEDFVQLVADEVISKIDNRTSRRDIVKLVKLAVNIIVNSGDVLVDCDCDDYKYRFNWIAKQYGYAATDRVIGHNYAPKITNPKLKGAMCKHLIRVLSRTSYWSDTACRKLINNLIVNQKFIQLINDKLLDKKEYTEDKDYDVNQPIEHHPNDDPNGPITDHDIDNHNDRSKDNQSNMDDDKDNDKGYSTNYNTSYTNNDKEDDNNSTNENKVDEDEDEEDGGTSK